MFVVARRFLAIGSRALSRAAASPIAFGTASLVTAEAP